jgi:hypothetical protein
MSAAPAVTGDDGASSERAQLAFALSKMRPADRDLAKTLFSMERYGEPAAIEARMKPLPVEYLFLAFNLRDPRNRQVLANALAKPAE